jgi:glycosyltransferase involved in cell wall biosynthesis
MSAHNDISIIVPVYNGGKNWTRVLDALAALNPAPDEILIVDDGSDDDSPQRARARGLSVLQTLTPRSGPAVARNLGARHARGDILFFLDADVLVAPDAIARVLVALADENVSAVFGSYDDAPDDATLISQYKNLQHHYVHQHSARDATTFWAGCGAIRRDVFLQLDGFAETYARPSIEDIELGYRLTNAGKKILLAPDLQVKHLKRWTLRSWLASDIRDRALPWSELLARQNKVARDLNLNAASRWSALLCWFGVFCFGAAFFFPALWFVVAGVIVALVALNFEFYRFLYEKRGAWFALRALPLHWLYFLYSSAIFGYVMLEHKLRN